MNASAQYAYQEVDNTDDREQVLLEHLPQVRYIARRIHERLPQHVPLEDLVHSGVLGLIDAFNKFDPHKHVQFSSYAKHRVRGAILDSLRELDWSPRELRRKARLLEDTHARLDTELGRAATEQEIADALGISLSRLQTLLTQLDGLEITSFASEAGDETREETAIEQIPATDAFNPFRECLDNELKSLLIKALAELPEREKQVLALYYYEELTMKEVGAVLGVGESRVSQIHSLAITRLRSRMQQTSSRTSLANAV
ncbi:MAG TPA: FliA/WhiG family RNA polymerase sigma factor [Terriglobales bacterium]|nr:FliA/WhiG family RNA polymerase sigma factor [Terriglobales bacterium]